MPFIDEPVYNIIQYFSSIVTNYLVVARKLAVILAIVGIAWNGIQVAFGTMEPRKYIVGMVTKWIFFVFCMTFFLSFSSWILTFSKQMGLYVSGSAIAECEKVLSDFYKDIKKLVEKELSSNQEAVEKLSEVIERQQENLVKYQQTIQKGYVDASTRIGDIESAKKWSEAHSILTNAEKERAELKRKIDNYKKYTKNGRIYNALESVLIIDDSNSTDRYYMNLEMKGVNDQPTGYLSPAAVLKVAVLCTQIIWENEWTDSNVVEWKDGQFGFKENGKPKKPNALQKKMVQTQRKIFDLVIALVLCLTLMFTIIASLIQYIMAIIEYSVCTGISLILIPCMLFDGTKDMANKILPSLFAQAVKLAMIYVCMFFCLWMMMDMAANLLMMNGTINWIFFANVMFSCLLTFTVCANAPKIAEALMSGRPMLSMGEFVQAMGAAAAGGRLAERAVSGTAGIVKGFNRGAQGVARFGANRIGDLAEAGAAGKANMAEQALKDFKEKGTKSSDWNENKAFIKGFAGSLASQTGRRLKGAAGDWIRGGKNGGGHGGGGSRAGDDPMKWVNNDPTGKNGIGGDSGSYDFASSKNFDNDGTQYTTRKSFAQYLASRTSDAHTRTMAAKAAMETLKNGGKKFDNKYVPASTAGKNSKGKTSRNNRRKGKGRRK